MAQGYLEQPELPPELHFYYETFWELGSEREQGMGGSGQIPGSAISRIAAEHGMGCDELDIFRSLMRSLDGIYMGHQANKHHQSDDKIVDSVSVDDHVGVSAILKRLAKPDAK